MTNPPHRHSRPVATIGTSWTSAPPTCVLDTPLANRYAGLSAISDELLNAREMLVRLSGESDHVIQSALWRAAASIYARCFSSAGKGMPKLEERDHLDSAPPDLAELHQFLITARHNFLSHAGGSTLEKISTHVVLTDPREGKRVKAVIAVRSVRSVPPTAEVEQFLRLLTFVLEKVGNASKLAYERVCAEIDQLNIDDLYVNARGMPDA